MSKSPSAREILLAHGVPEDVVDDALSVHVHELGEKIREHQPPQGLEGRFLLYANFRAGITDAADLIDPEGAV